MINAVVAMRTRTDLVAISSFLDVTAKPGTVMVPTAKLVRRGPAAWSTPT